MVSRPAYLVNPSTADLVADIQDTRQIINSAYFVDPFMDVAGTSIPARCLLEAGDRK